MNPNRMLVVYYSRTGTTQVAAEAIRDALGCEIEPIADKKHRGGVLGYLRSAIDAIRHRPAVLEPMKADPSAYDLVIVGTPTWNASVSTPARTFLSTYRDRMKRVAFFCTQGGSGGARVLREMTEICGQSPVATLVLRADEVKHRAHAQQVRAFTLALVGAPAPGEPAEASSVPGLRPQPT